MYIFTKFTYNEYIGPYFLLHVVLRFFASDLPLLPLEVREISPLAHHMLHKLGLKSRLVFLNTELGKLHNLVTVCHPDMDGVTI